ncbi:TPA: hypothetical protein ACPZG0_000633 [Yersinia enterocolitica]
MARNDSFNQPWASVPAQFERPGDGLIARGWAGGASEDPPEAKWENWWHNRVDLALQELQNLGQLIWFTDAPYQAGARVSHGGNSYIALSENTGVEPTGTLDIGVWRKEGDSTYLQTANNLAEIAAAGPEAIAEAQASLNLAELLGDALQKANNLSEIKAAGPAAVAQTLLNLGLGDAAKRTIGTGNNNVPDIATADERYKPLSYIPPLSQVWLSSEYTPVLNTPIIVSHGLTIPDPLKCKADVILKCIVANNGYAVGETAIGLGLWVQSTTILPPTPLLTTTTIQINSGSQGSSGWLMGQRSNGGIATAVDPAYWRLIFRIIY